MMRRAFLNMHVRPLWLPPYGELLPEFIEHIEKCRPKTSAEERGVLYLHHFIDTRRRVEKSDLPCDGSNREILR